MTRASRNASSLRPLEITTGTAPYAEGSCTIHTGQTRVLCAASVLNTVPEWRMGSGKGWVTAEYSMLPRSTHTRRDREREGLQGRTQEIQRLIGRSLRGVVDLSSLGERTIIVDCDVLQADGGTRTASVTGGCVALALALDHAVAEGLVEASPLTGLVAAVSVGLVGGRALLDLDYREDVGAQVDMNVVATEDGKLVEVQGTAEGAPFPREQLDALLDLAEAGIRELIVAQRRVLER